MILAVGIDIVEVERIRVVLNRTRRFAERVFTIEERRYCDARGAAAWQHYAARFAAKEAMLKALGTGWSGGISWHDVEVWRNQMGAPQLLLRGHALKLFEQAAANAVHLSMSHTFEHAIAQVIIERLAI